ncbi:MAG: hypothetical protein EOO06_05250 [Chitinophagaceae bacterium]|nr:MAG: hypothetical protein EOO06_05250 [Chitinophagaceae bacterium]
MKQHSIAEAQIDVTDIWSYEREQLRVEKATTSQFQDLRQAFIPFYILKKHVPFVSRIAVQEDPSLTTYYENYERRLGHDDQSAIDYFKYRGAFYDMNESCVIGIEDVNKELYTELFALKLRQLEEDDDQLKWMVGFHYHKEFHGDEKSFKDLLSSLRLYSDMLPPVLLSSLRDMADNLETLPPKEEYQEKSDLVSRASEELSKEEETPNQTSNDLTSQEKRSGENEASVLLGNEEEKLIESSCAPIPIPNEGQWTTEEIDHFFSFLYQSRGEGEGSYLTREQVETMLQKGIAIPAVPLAQKYKLLWSPRYTKKFVEYFIHKFITHYNLKEKKRILIFFGSYIEDFSLALHPKTLQNLNKNITGDKPKNLLFKPEDYLPKRFH